MVGAVHADAKELKAVRLYVERPPLYRLDWLPFLMAYCFPAMKLAGDLLSGPHARPYAQLFLKQTADETLLAQKCMFGNMGPADQMVGTTLRRDCLWQGYLVFGIFAAAHILLVLFTHWSVDVKCAVAFRVCSNVHRATHCKVRATPYAVRHWVYRRAMVEHVSSEKQQLESAVYARTLQVA